MANGLAFEQVLTDLRNKIEELQSLSDQHGLSLQPEIAVLEERYKQVRSELYSRLTPAQKMQVARSPKRLTTLDYIEYLFTDFFEFHGDRLFGEDKAIVGGIGRLEGMPVTIIGHQKGCNTKENVLRNFGMPHPEGFRKAVRLMRQANRFARPIITFIDTPGAYPGDSAERRGQSEAIARSLYEMSKLEVPVISVVIGEGGSGGALALGVGNRILMLEHSIYAVASPNAAAAILWKDASRANEAAEAMKITAQDLYGLGVIDEIIPETESSESREQADVVKEAIYRHLCELLKMKPDDLRTSRYEKFRRMGAYEIERQQEEALAETEHTKESSESKQEHLLLV